MHLPNSQLHFIYWAPFHQSKFSRYSFEKHVVQRNSTALRLRWWWWWWWWWCCEKLMWRCEVKGWASPIQTLHHVHEIVYPPKAVPWDMHERQMASCPAQEISVQKKNERDELPDDAGRSWLELEAGHWQPPSIDTPEITRFFCRETASHKFHMHIILRL